MEFFKELLRPEVLWVVIPVVAIVMVYGAKMVSRYFEHVERLAKIEAGIDPDAGDAEETD